MKEQLISFETAKLAKEKGFTNQVTKYRNVWRNYVDSGGNKLDEGFYKVELTTEEETPTQSLLQKWLREVHNIHIQNHFLNNKYAVKIKYDVNKSQNVYNKDTYEEALEKGLQEALSLI